MRPIPETPTLWTGMEDTLALLADDSRLLCQEDEYMLSKCGSQSLEFFSIYPPKQQLMVTW